MEEEFKKKEKKDSGGAPAWLLTYGDMVTLLLTFFVLLLSMANFEKVKVVNALNSFQQAMGIMPSLTTVAVMPHVVVPKMGGDQQRRRIAVKVAKDIAKQVKQKNLKESVKVKVTETGIAIKLSDPENFLSGSSDLSRKAKKALMLIASRIRNLPNDPSIRVEGHTDNVPIHNMLYKSNWHLSSARALSVIEYLSKVSNIPPDRLQAVGYGEYRPIAPNNTAAGRKKNRRIEIYVDFIKKKEMALTNYWSE